MAHTLTKYQPVPRDRRVLVYIKPQSVDYGGDEAGWFTAEYSGESHYGYFRIGLNMIEGCSPIDESEIIAWMDLPPDPYIEGMDLDAERLLDDEEPEEPELVESATPPKPVVMRELKVARKDGKAPLYGFGRNGDVIEYYALEPTTIHHNETIKLMVRELNGSFSHLATCDAQTFLDPAQWHIPHPWQAALSTTDPIKFSFSSS